MRAQGKRPLEHRPIPLAAAGCSAAQLHRGFTPVAIAPLPTKVCLDQAFPQGGPTPNFIPGVDAKPNYQAKYRRGVAASKPIARATNS